MASRHHDTRSETGPSCLPAGRQIAMSRQQPRCHRSAAFRPHNASSERRPGSSPAMSPNPAPAALEAALPREVGAKRDLPPADHGEFPYPNRVSTFPPGMCMCGTARLKPRLSTPAESCAPAKRRRRTSGSRPTPPRTGQSRPWCCRSRSWRAPWIRPRACA